MMINQKPEFFIVGAPKCATTALYSYLKDHPKVFMPQKKEPHYFSPELSDYFVVERSLEGYLNLFSPAQEGQICGEASVMYLQSETAIQKALDFNPDAKFIAMIRNPVEAAISMHLQTIKSRFEDKEHFIDAWNLQDDRARGHHIPSRCTDPSMLQYRDLLALGSQLEQFMKIVPESQRMIIVYDDFKENTEKLYREVISFLGLELPEQYEFPVVNPTATHMSPLLEKRLARIRSYNVPLVGPVLYFLKRAYIYWVRPVLRPAYVPPVKDKPKSAVYATLEAYFEPEIVKLERLLDRSFDHWFKHSDRVVSQKVA